MIKSVWKYRGQSTVTGTRIPQQQRFNTAEGFIQRRQGHGGLCIKLVGHWEQHVFRPINHIVKGELLIAPGSAIFHVQDEVLTLAFVFSYHLAHAVNFHHARLIEEGGFKFEVQR